MDASAFLRGGRGRGGIGHDGRGRPLSRNKHWSATDGNRSQSHTPNNVESERWERGGHRGGGRGRGHQRGMIPKFSNVSLRLDNTRQQRIPQEVAESHVEVDEGHEAAQDEDILNEDHDMDQEEFGHYILEPELETQEERDKFYQELVKAREVERKKAIAEGKMDDPLVPKRLEDAINIVGTCMDMCPRFERYRREKENNLFEWETIPGTRRVDHNRAVKMYERGAGDRILPSDLRPPHILKRTLDYLFYDLLARGGFSPTFNFIRDRSRAVRNDFAMQRITGTLAMECHDRCARFHILALHLQRHDPSFSIPLEEQQLMNTLQSLKEFYQDQRGKYQSPTELEMRVYHRLIHIRDQRERHDDIPDHIQLHPVFKLTTAFRLHVQKHSAPITKTSTLTVTDEGMQIFSNLAAVLIEQGNTVMVYLVACILERLFGQDTIEDIESLQGDLTIPEIIDGTPGVNVDEHTTQGDSVEILHEAEPQSDAEPRTQPLAPTPLKPTSSPWPFPRQSTPPTTRTTSSTTPATGNAFEGLVSQSTASGTTNVFGNTMFSVSPSKSATPAFGTTSSSQHVFGGASVTSAPQPFSMSMSIPPEQTSSPFPTTGSTTKPTQFLTRSASNFGANQAPASDTAQPVLTNISTINRAEASSLSTQPATTVNTGPSTPDFSSTISLNPKAPDFTPSSVAMPIVFPQPSSFSPLPMPTLSTPLVPPVSRPNTDMPMQSTPPTTEPGVPTPKPSLAPPLLNRPTAPPMLRIDTNTTSGSSSNPSPALPPTPKLQPVSLPSTPVVLPPNPHVVHLRSALEFRGSPFSSSSKGILSPLLVGTPTSTLHNFSPLSTPQTSKVFQAPPPPSINGKGKAPDSKDVEVIEKMKKIAIEFSQKSLLVKNTFASWLKRTMDRAAWHEACKRGDEYRQKINSQSRHSSVFRSPARSVTPQEKKRQVSTNGLDSSPPKKRARKRISSDYRPPRTDEDLAKRLKENLEEYEQRWAQGSFLKVIKKFVQSISPSTSRLPWDIWLSLNPESDATAIWLERKFDMPDSGSWVSESVFRIPLTPSKRGPGFPGMLVFECTPVGDVDELEKKYRALDDCSRLRDLIAALPAKRHFVPSLLVIHWAEEESSIASDFSSMAKQLESESRIQTYHVFSMTAATKELDQRLQKLLPSLQLDTEGKLVQSLGSKTLFKIFEPTFTSFFNEWMENSKNSHCMDWKLYREIIKASISVLDTMSRLVYSLLEISKPREPFPDFDHDDFVDSSSAYDSVMDWLSKFNSRDDARIIATDLQSHRNIGQEFPLPVFIDLLYGLMQVRIERLDRSAYLILISDLNAALETLKQELEPHHLRLLQIYNFSVRRSPKRRTYSIASSEQGSPEAKRPRLASPVASTNDGDDEFISVLDLPSPTPSTVSLARTDTPTVTVSMLRALTKDLRKRYIT